MKYKLLTLLFILFFGISNAQSYQKTDNGIKATSQSVQIDIQFFSPTIVRVLKTPKGTTLQKNSLSVVKTPVKTNLKITDSGNLVTISSSAFNVALNIQTGRISFSGAKDNQLFTEKDYGIQFTPTTDVNKQTFIARQAFLMDKDETVYGLGQ